MKLKERVQKIITNNRDSMRYAALRYREAKKRGSLSFMLKWLILAVTFRELNKGYLESL